MVLANCSQCGILFNRTAVDKCAACYKEEEALFEETLNYIRKNPNITMADVLENIEIEQELLEQWIEEKRIQLFDSGKTETKTICIYCGRPINKGEKICKTCMYKQVALRKNQPCLSNPIDEGENELSKNRGMHVKYYP
jgi:predicted amidophosphoribosyltransferase